MKETKLTKEEKQYIKDMIADKLVVEELEVIDDSKLIKDLGADSLDYIDICMELEKKFNIMIPDPLLEKVVLIRDFYPIIEKLIKK